MSECRWCDTCQKPFSALDDDARRINIEEPEIIGGIRRGTVTVQRDQCGGCMRELNRRSAEARRLTMGEEVTHGDRVDTVA